MELTAAQLQKIAEPLPKDAVKENPAKKGFSAIKSIYITERFNEVFGVGGWQIRTEVISYDSQPVLSETLKSAAGREYTTHYGIVKTIFDVPACDIHYECIAGSKNEDAGDALKGAITDSLSKIASWIGIGIDVFKGQHEEALRAFEQDQHQQARKAEEDADPNADAIGEAVAKISSCDTVEKLAALRDSLPPEIADSVRFKREAVSKYNRITKKT